MKLKALIWAAGLLLLDAAIAAAQTLPADQGHRLSAGTKRGTFHFEYHLVHGTLTEPAHAWLAIALSAANDASALAKTNVAANGDLALSQELEPGTYQILLEAFRKDPEWSASPITPVAYFHIDRQGTVHYFYGGPPSESFARRVEGMRPTGIAVDNAGLAFRWDAVPDAAYYRVRLELVNNWFPPASSAREFRTDRCEFALPQDAGGADAYAWRVAAYNAAGQPIADAIAWFHDPRVRPPVFWVMNPLKRRFVQRVGIAPFDSYVGAQIRNVHAGSLMVVRTPPGTKPEPAIYVLAIAPSSPAIDADLLPGDLIVKVNGKAVDLDENGSQLPKFAEQITQSEPGTVLRFTIRRNEGLEREVGVKIGSADDAKK
jgi:hypothetical protein